MKKIIIIAGIGVVMIGLGVVLMLQDSKTSNLAVKDNKTALAQVGQEYPNLGQTHINPGTAHAPYNSNPPTSGPHYPQPANWGIYNNELPDEQLVHNEEHGGIWISYKDIDDTTKAKLEAIAKANPGSVIMTPRAADDAKIVLASWTRLEKLDSYDEGKVLEFIKSNKNKSPEPVAQ